MKIDFDQCSARWGEYRCGGVLQPIEEPMLTRYITTAVLTVALMTGAASAQTTTKNNAPSDSATTQEYSAYKLVGVNLYNEGNEKLGEIKDILLEKSGKADKVVLSVGGFLGIAEHYVAVPFDQVKWVDEPARSASGDSRTTTGAASSTSSGRKWYPDHAVYNATKDQLKAMPEFKY
jgi:sporulation protein YlmC with PRC-barrel domain